MKTIKITDITLRECENKKTPLSFKEKVEFCKLLDKVNVSAVELPALSGNKADELLTKTVAQTMKNSTVAIPVGYSVDSVGKAYNAISKAKHKRLIVAVPVSTVQMEYICARKAPKVIELIDELTKACKGLCDDVEFAALDASRADEEFLASAVKTAVLAGASSFTYCDTAGTMLPSDTEAGFTKLFESIPELQGVSVNAELSNGLDLSTACAFSAVKAGATGIKATVGCEDFPSLVNVVKLIDKKGEAIGAETKVQRTELNRAVKSMLSLCRHNDNIASASEEKMTPKLLFNKEASLEMIREACLTIGYDLSGSDMASVYDAFMRVATKKETVSERELEAIIASTALQVEPTYVLDSYVINSGNIISATANVVLLKGDEKLTGVSVGDGPIDAAFRAIEQILGHHYDLDDFQIQSVTEGREAMGEAVVKLRANGSLYSGTGISTDIIGASIRAYVSTVNKIVYKED